MTQTGTNEPDVAENVDFQRRAWQEVARQNVLKQQKRRTLAELVDILHAHLRQIHSAKCVEPGVRRHDVDAGREEVHHFLQHERLVCDKVWRKFGLAWLKWPDK